MQNIYLIYIEIIWLESFYFGFQCFHSHLGEQIQTTYENYLKFV